MMDRYRDIPEDTKMIEKNKEVARSHSSLLGQTQIQPRKRVNFKANLQRNSYQKGKHEFAKSLEQLRKLSKQNDKERKAKLEANDSSKIFSDFFGEIKPLST